MIEGIHNGCFSLFKVYILVRGDVMKGYKMLNNDMTTLYGNMTYEIGKTYKLDGEIIPCERGYHFCKELISCLLYYPNKNNDKRFFEIETGENVIERDDKCISDEITLVRELSLDEVLQYIRENESIVNWTTISNRQKLPEEFIREFKDKVDWRSISINQQLSEDFIREFKNKVDWVYIDKHQNLSEEFIREFKDKVDWYCISIRQRLSEDFIREFQDELNWSRISMYQKLSEDFIREFKDSVDWFYISRHQKLSRDFIREFQDELNWYCIGCRKNLNKNLKIN